MKKWLALFASCVLFASVASAQQPVYKQSVFDDTYRNTVKAAEELYDTKKYQQAAEKYVEAFTHSGGKSMMSDRYNAACCWAMAGNKDSAMRYLTILGGGRYTRYNHVMIDPDLESLHNEPGWNAICEKLKANRLIGQTSLNIPLVEQLDTIFREDQQYRMRFEMTANKYGSESKEMQDLIKTATKSDELNIKKVIAILDKYGWPGSDIAGDEGNNTIFLVIQHAETPVQEKYLPMMREAVKNNKAKASALALLEDRVALAEGRKQIYGSQVSKMGDGPYTVDDIEDPANVDKRRSEVGLPPLAEYLRQYGIKWDVNEYIKQQAVKK
ncbi:MAG: hypothetical protein JST82_02520 [Bacteroidetes bacterium]|nr:hypothetical protein [Bacteroidota bacterium]